MGQKMKNTSSDKSAKRKGQDLTSGKRVFKKQKVSSHPQAQQKAQYKPQKKVRSLEDEAAKQAAAKLQAARVHKTEKKENLKSAVTQWEKLRRHDTPAAERRELLATVLQQVNGRIGEVANSPTGSRVMQACAKHGNPQQRLKMLAEIMPQILELIKSPYAHFLVCKLIATIPRQDLKGVFSAVRGHVPTLLRHPCGAAVIDELFNIASAAQKNHLVAEFYGKEYSVLTHEAAPGSLTELFRKVDPQKRRTILQRMAVHLLPIMEKALVDPVITHRLIAEYLRFAPESSRADAFDNLSGDALLRMVHTKDGAWIANSVICHGTAKDCKNFVKALKGHIETMAKDRWGSLVISSILSHVDDTVLVLKIVLPVLKEKCKELIIDKNARGIYLQLLAPNCSRYLQPELLDIVNPAFSALAGPSSNFSQKTDQISNMGDGISQMDSEGNDQEFSIAKADSAATARKKDGRVRSLELLGQGDKGVGEKLLLVLRESVAQLMTSPQASEILAETASGGVAGVLLEGYKDAVEGLQDTIVAVVKEQSHIVEDIYGSRLLRRLILNNQEAATQYDKVIAKRFADQLWSVFKPGGQRADTHAKKVDPC